MYYFLCRGRPTFLAHHDSNAQSSSAYVCIPWLLRLAPSPPFLSPVTLCLQAHTLIATECIAEACFVLRDPPHHPWPRMDFVVEHALTRLHTAHDSTHAVGRSIWEARKSCVAARSVETSAAMGGKTQVARIRSSGTQTHALQRCALSASISGQTLSNSGWSSWSASTVSYEASRIDV